MLSWVYRLHLLYTKINITLNIYELIEYVLYEGLNIINRDLDFVVYIFHIWLILYTQRISLAWNRTMSIFVLYCVVCLLSYVYLGSQLSIIFVCVFNSSIFAHFNFITICLSKHCLHFIQLFLLLRLPLFFVHTFWIPFLQSIS